MKQIYILRRMSNCFAHLQLTDHIAVLLYCEWKASESRMEGMQKNVQAHVYIFSLCVSPLNAWGAFHLTSVTFANIIYSCSIFETTKIKWFWEKVLFTNLKTLDTLRNVGTLKHEFTSVYISVTSNEKQSAVSFSLMVMLQTPKMFFLWKEWEEETLFRNSVQQVAHRGACCESNALLWLQNMGQCPERTL